MIRYASPRFGAAAALFAAGIAARSKGKVLWCLGRHDLFAALTDWVEGGAAPKAVISTRYVAGSPAKDVAMQRPLCAYPAKAWWRGASGSRQSPSDEAHAGKSCLDSGPASP